MPSNGDPVNEQYQEFLSVGPFGGLDTTTEPFFVAPTNFIDGRNFSPNSGYGGFVTVQGRQAFLAAPLPGQCTGMHSIAREGLPDLYLFAVAVSGVGHIYSAIQGGTATEVPTPVPLTPDLQTSFADGLQWAFITNGLDTPIKFDVISNVITFWGIVAPTSAPTLSIGSASTMNGTYYYSITYSNPLQESSQGVISDPITVTNTGVNLTNIPISSDSQVTQRNIYRIGGALGQWRLIFTINDNTTTTYSDTLGDDQVTGHLLTVDRDPPPVFDSIISHKERIWGFGTPDDHSVVYYSNYGEPWGFNLVTGFLPVGSNSFNDVAVGMASIGTQLVLMKTKTTYNVTGSTDADFQSNKLFDIGCRSSRSICSAYGVCWWLSKQGIYQFDGSSPQNLSDGVFQQSNIKSVIQGLALSDLLLCTSFVYDRMVHFCFPSINTSFFWDLRSQGWYSISWALDQVVFNLESEVPVVGTNLQSVGQIDQWFAAPGDFGQSIDSYIISRITDSGNIASTKEYRYVELQAPIQNGTVTISTIVDPGALQVTDITTFNLTSGFTRQQSSLKKGMVGAEVQVKLLVRAATTIHIQKAAIHGYIKALYRPNS